MTGRIYFGDARAVSSHEEAAVHLVITSPPYWSIKDYGTQEQIGFNSDFESYLADLETVWKRCWDRLLPGCKMCINVGDQFLRAKDHGRYRVLPIRSHIIMQMDTLGADYMGAIIWRKMTNTQTSGGGTLMGSYPHPRNGILKLDYEFILVFKKPGKAPRPTAEQKAQSVMPIEEWSQNFTAHWDFPGERQKGHHAMFPMELPRRLIRMFSFPNERVLDPFVGSGTTVAAALEQGREGEGIELNRAFKDTIEARLGPHLQHISMEGCGGQLTKAARAPSPYGSAVTLQDLGKDRWKGTGRVEAVEGPTQVRVAGRSWLLEGILPCAPECMTVLSDLVAHRKVTVEPTSEHHAYIRLMNRTLINARLIHLGVAEPDPMREHRNRSRFQRYAKERIQNEPA